MFKYETKKMLSNKIILIIWMIILGVAYISIRKFNIHDTFADLFLKLYELLPAMGFMIFGLTANLYTVERKMIVYDLVHTTTKGHLIPVYKFIAAGTVTSLVNISIFLILIVKVLLLHGTHGFFLPINELWYFSQATINISVLTMIFLTTITIILGSFLFSGISLVIGVITKSSAMTFVFGGLIMGIPYLTSFLFSNISLYLPIKGMIAGKMIAENAHFSHYIIQIIIFILIIIACPLFVYKQFNKITEETK